jgi:hypothetical protein
MQTAIVTTTINPPTKATFKFAEIAKKNNWIFIIVGDTKTPHELYTGLAQCYPENVMYLSPEYQEKKYSRLSAAIGWKSIQRRNIGFVEAYRLGFHTVISVDDDNVPNNDWGKNIFISQEVEVDIWDNTQVNCFDPLSVTNNNDLWQRGYPIQLVKDKNRVEYKGKQIRKVMVQNDLVDGDPDIDATARLIKKPIVKFDKINIFGSNQIAPFNSQNLFLDASVLPHYFCHIGVGRFDDIWGGYILQKYFPNSLVFGQASVYQDRNPQDLITNLENEIWGYRNTLSLINDLDNYEKYLPEKSLEAFKIYQDSF